MRCLLIPFFILILFSCKGKKPNTQPINLEKKNKVEITSPESADQVIHLTPEFIEENEINLWADFKKLMDAMEDISQLNPEGIMTYLIELYKISIALVKNPFPQKFNKLPIYSRVKVVQTQIIKCHYYASNKQNQKLNQALDQLYSEYNILISRMISMAEENKMPLDTLGIDLPFFQDSKMNPALSKK